MSLTAMTSAMSPGLNPAQANARSIPDNIARVNSPAHVRTLTAPAARIGAGHGTGLSIEGEVQTADRYLRVAGLAASSDAGRWSAISQGLGEAQRALDFPRPDGVFTAYAAAADDPSPSRRSRVIGEVEDFLTQSARIQAQAGQMGEALDTQILADIARANDLLGRISQLNIEISRSKLAGGEASAPESVQSQLVDELAVLINVRVATKAGGGVIVRSGEGLTLARDSQAARLSYSRADPTRGYVAIEPQDEMGSAQPIQITGGQIAGRMELRDSTLPTMAGQFGDFVSHTADQINAVHNKATSSPAPNALTGRDTGLDIQSAVTGFTGRATIAVLGSAGSNQGVVQHKVEIDFDAMTMTPGGGFGATDFLPALNRALGGSATASFIGGALGVQGADGAGVAIDEGSSMKAGRGFSHVFGLNDLIQSSGAGDRAKFKVDPAVTQNPMKLGLGVLDLSVTMGERAISVDDGGARQISEIGAPLSRYAAEFSGSIEHLVQTADARTSKALEVAKEATARRAAVQSVSLHEELAVMTTYQQASSAAARMSQAARGLSDMLAKIA